MNAYAADLSDDDSRKSTVEPTTPSEAKSRRRSTRGELRSHSDTAWIDLATLQLATTVVERRANVRNQEVVRGSRAVADAPRWDCVRATSFFHGT